MHHEHERDDLPSYFFAGSPLDAAGLLSPSKSPPVQWESSCSFGAASAARPFRALLPDSPEGRDCDPGPARLLDPPEVRGNIVYLKAYKPDGRHSPGGMEKRRTSRMAARTGELLQQAETLVSLHRSSRRSGRTPHCRQIGRLGTPSNPTGRHLRHGRCSPGQAVGGPGVGPGRRGHGATAPHPVGCAGALQRPQVGFRRDGGDGHHEVPRAVLRVSSPSLAGLARVFVRMGAKVRGCEDESRPRHERRR